MSIYIQAVEGILIRIVFIKLLMEHTAPGENKEAEVLLHLRAILVVIYNARACLQAL